MIAETDILPASSAPRLRHPRQAVFLTHSSFSSPFRVGSHQLALVLGQRGCEVLHVPTPVTPAHLPSAFFNPIYRQRVGDAARLPRVVQPRVREWIPFALLPWQVCRWSKRLAPALYSGSQVLAGKRIRQTRMQQPDLLFVDEPRLIGMASWFQAAHRVYRATDLYSEMMADPSVIAAEKTALQQTDCFIATSQPVFDHLRRLAPGKPGLLLENGVEHRHFAEPRPEPADLKTIPGPRAIYVGALDERFDFNALVTLARQRPQLSLVVIGPLSGRMPELPANVHCLGPRPYDQIPAYLQHCTVGLLILSQHPANRGRSPMKIYEYAAAGLPVIASGTDEILRRDLPFVLCYQQPAELPALWDRMQIQHSALVHAARMSAAQMSWDSRLDELLAFVSKLPANPSAGPTTRSAR